MERWKTVLHLHTNHSYDSNTAPRDLVKTASLQGVKCLGVTDHDTVSGALEAQRVGRERDVVVIVGSEISAREGHVIGLFLTDDVPPGRTADETARRIRDQGGVVLAPHPASWLCDRALSFRTVEHLLPWLDAIEICNAQNPLLWENWRAEKFSRRRQIPAYVGADTHIRGYLAGAYQIMDPFADADGFRAALSDAELHAGCFGPGYFARMGGRHVWDLFSQRRLPGFGLNAPRPAYNLRRAVPGQTQAKST